MSDDRPEYRIQIDGQTQAQSNSLGEMTRYTYQYVADGEVTLQWKSKKGGRWKTLLTVPEWKEQNDE
jgi:hypothetical protein